MKEALEGPKKIPIQTEEKVDSGTDVESARGMLSTEKMNNINESTECDWGTHSVEKMLLNLLSQATTFT